MGRVGKLLKAIGKDRELVEAKQLAQEQAKKPTGPAHPMMMVVTSQKGGKLMSNQKIEQPVKEPAFQLQITNKLEAPVRTGSSDVNLENNAPNRKGTGSALTDEETQTNTRIDAKSPVRGSKDSRDFASHALINAKLEQIQGGGGVSPAKMPAGTSH